jgi:transposase
VGTSKTRHPSPPLRELGKARFPLHLIMDRAYEGAETRQLALEPGFIPVVPPKQNRITAWEYDRAMYKRRNEIERLFRRLKGFRRSFPASRSSISCL